jgi:hypothetical protein
LATDGELNHRQPPFLADPVHAIPGNSTPCHSAPCHAKIGRQKWYHPTSGVLALPFQARHIHDPPRLSKPCLGTTV